MAAPRARLVRYLRSGWVCPDHPALPFEHDDCGAEGARCICNPTRRRAVGDGPRQVPKDEPLN